MLGDVWEIFVHQVLVSFAEKSLQAASFQNCHRSILSGEFFAPFSQRQLQQRHFQVAKVMFVEGVFFSFFTPVSKRPLEQSA